jgi:hypothetical protein
VGRDGPEVAYAMTQCSSSSWQGHFHGMDRDAPWRASRQSVSPSEGPIQAVRRTDTVQCTPLGPGRLLKSSLSRSCA